MRKKIANKKFVKFTNFHNLHDVHGEKLTVLYYYDVTQSNLKRQNGQ